MPDFISPSVDFSELLIKPCLWSSESPNSPPDPESKLWEALRSRHKNWQLCFFPKTILGQDGNRIRALQWSSRVMMHQDAQNESRELQISYPNLWSCKGLWNKFTKGSFAVRQWTEDKEPNFPCLSSRAKTVPRGISLREGHGWTSETSTTLTTRNCYWLLGENSPMTLLSVPHQPFSLSNFPEHLIVTEHFMWLIVHWDILAHFSRHSTMHFK